MSSTSAAAAAASAPAHWCHMCNEVVHVIGSGDEVVCQRCYRGFVEEMQDRQEEEQRQQQQQHPHQWQFGGTAIRGDEAVTRIMEGLSGVFNRVSMAEPAVSQEEAMFDFLHGMLGQLGLRGSIQLMFDGPGPDSMSSLEELIQHLMENDPNRYGSPPAAKSAVDSLPVVKISQAHLQSEEGAYCAVCKDEFNEGNEALQMPCTHIYHRDCILPWLELHSTCPVCRHPLPTDDENSSNPNQGASTSSSNPSGPPPAPSR